MIPFEDSVATLEVTNFHLPRFVALPAIDLYRDQLLNYVEEQLKLLWIDPNEKILTASMVNNYVKQRLVLPPIGKKYTRTHVANFIVISILKQVLSISEISSLLKIQMLTYPMDVAYDYLAEQFEYMIRIAFTTQNFSDSDTASKSTYETRLVRSAVISIANKLYLQKYLQNYKEEAQESAGKKRPSPTKKKDSLNVRGKTLNKT